MTGGDCGTDPLYPTFTWKIDDPGAIVIITLLGCTATGGSALSFQNEKLFYSSSNPMQLWRLTGSIVCGVLLHAGY
jgi:hypothetical protein